MHLILMRIACRSFFAIWRQPYVLIHNQWTDFGMLFTVNCTMKHEKSDYEKRVIRFTELPKNERTILQNCQKNTVYKTDKQ